MYIERQQEALTIVSTFLGLNRFLLSGRPHTQPLFTNAVQWCGLQVQLAVWVGLGGHGHAVQEAGEHGVASRHFLHGGFDGGVVAYALWGRRLMVDFRTGFGIPRGFLWCSIKIHTQNSHQWTSFNIIKHFFFFYESSHSYDFLQNTTHLTTDSVIIM